MYHLPALLASQLLHPPDYLLISGREPFANRTWRLGSDRVLEAQGAGQLAAKVGRKRQQAHVRVVAITIRLMLFLSVAQVVEVLHADELRPAVVLGDGLHARKIRGPHGARAEVAHLARLHQIVEGFHGLFDWCGGVEAVDLI